MKQYKPNLIPLIVMLLIGYVGILVLNLPEATKESFVKASLWGVIGLTIIIVGSAYSYVQIKGKRLEQRDWYFIWRSVDLDDVETIIYDPKHNWFFAWVEYLLIYKKGENEPALKINPNSYKPEILAELLRDIKELNQEIKLDKGTEKRMKE